METRFRNFVNKRRTRSIEAGNELSQASVPYQAVSSATRQPIFLYQPLAKNHRESRKNEGISAIPLRSFSYENCQPGKAPTMGTVPQKGNGPIKLQGTRRLSSGDQVTTQHDTQDLREGGYVVAKITRNSSIDQRCSPPAAAISAPLSPTHSDLASPRLATPMSSRTWPSTPVVSPETQHTSLRYSRLPGQPSCTDSFIPAERPSPRDSHESLSTTRLHSPHASFSQESIRSGYGITDSNATLKALRKAEFSRLAELYGSDAAAARNIAHIDSARLRATSSPNAYTPPMYSPKPLEPLPPPPAERSDTDLGRPGDTSTNDFCYDSRSGSSSPQRTSYVSSCAGSSVMTGQTSLEDEPATTREEIRSVVEQMRHTYLSAIESQALSTPKVKTRRKARRSKLKPPKTINESEHSPKSNLVLRQTWHPPETQQDVSYKRRVNSHPVSRSGGALSPIPASPNKNEPSGLGLHRADSATLGGLMGEIQRESIRSRKESRSRISDSLARPTTPLEQIHASTPEIHSLEPTHADQHDTPTDTTPTESSNAHVESTVLHVSNEDSAAPSLEIDALFADDLWSSDTQLSSFSGSEFSLQTTSSNDSYTIAQPALQVTPKKQAQRISSIPESPEYTHLARNTLPENNFI